MLCILRFAFCASSVLHFAFRASRFALQAEKGGGQGRLNVLALVVPV